MTDDFLVRLAAQYDAYVDTFRAPDGTLPEMMQLKRDHTARVVANAQASAAGEGFAPQTARVCAAEMSAKRGGAPVTLDEAYAACRAR